MLTILGMLNPIAAGTSSIIQSIQQVSITIADGATSNTGTISAVTVANTMLAWNSTFSGTPVRQHNGLDHNCYVVLTDGTTVTATRIGSKSALTVKVTVLEFQSSAIAGIQSGSIALGSGITSATATITSAVMADSLCHYNGSTFSVTANSTVAEAVNTLVFLPSATRVASQRAAADAGTSTGYFTVVQFSPGTLNSSTQQISISATTSGSIEAAITSAATTNTVTFFGNYLSSATNFTLSNIANLSIKSVTSVAFESHIGPVLRKSTGTIVNFKPSNINQIQRGTIEFTPPVTTATATITSAAANKTCILHLGVISSANTGLVSNNVYYRAIDLTNPTTITAQLGAATTAASKTSFEAITFI